MRKAAAGNNASGLWSTFYDLAMNSATSREVLNVLARNLDDHVRRAAAWNNATPPEALAALARDPDRDVRQAIALKGSPHHSLKTAR